MLDMLSPDLEGPVRSQSQNMANQRTALLERAWNALIPKCSVSAEVIPAIGVKYLHPTKGYKFVGKRRFAIRGVI